MSVIPKFILTRIRRAFLFRYEDLMSEHRSLMLNRLRQKVNVQLAGDLQFGEYSSFAIHGDVMGMKIAEGVKFSQYCHVLLYPGASLTIAKGVFFNNYCSVNCLGNIEIGENTLFGEGVKIYDHNHTYSYTDGTLRVDRDKFAVGEVSIGKNCWIGSNVTILNNVNIGDNVIIGANTLIFKSVPPNSIVKAKTAYIIG